MDTKKIDMAYSNSGCSPCCGPYDNQYPIGFYLDHKQFTALGIPEDVEPGATMEIVATIKISSVTKREEQNECYACITEMGIVKKTAKASPNKMMAAAYKGDSDGEQQG